LHFEEVLLMGTIRIVVVDDEAMIRTVVFRKLALWGYPETVGIVPEMSSEHTAQLILDAAPNIVVIDHDFGLDFTGVNVAELLRQEGFEGDIIVFSSHSVEAQKALFGPYEILAYVVKPDSQGLREPLERAAEKYIGR